MLQEAVDQTPAQGNIARIPCADLALNEDWESLSSERKAKRASKLASRAFRSQARVVSFQ